MDELDASPIPDYEDRCEFTELLGKTLLSVSVNDRKDEITYTCTDGTVFMQFHDQDCCENVDINDINGDLADLIGSPILVAEVAKSDDADPPGVKCPDDRYEHDSFTWSFYKLDTAKGGVTIRWYGESNGYYSQEVDFGRMKRPSDPTDASRS